MLAQGKQNHILTDVLKPVAPALRPLEGRAAIVTGSTSGIGWGIARAFAESGAAVMLNGLSDKDEAERQRRTLSEAFDVDVGYSDADMSKPEAIQMMAETAENDSEWSTSW